MPTSHLSRIEQSHLAYSTTRSMKCAAHCVESRRFRCHRSGRPDGSNCNFSARSSRTVLLGEVPTVKRIKITFQDPDASKDPYAYFLLCKGSIGLLLKQGFQIKRIWEAYKEADPPFPGSYSVFCRYCAKHELSPMGRTGSPCPVEAPSSAVSAKSEKATTPPGIDVEKYRNKFDFRPSWTKES